MDKKIEIVKLSSEVSELKKEVEEMKEILQNILKLMVDDDDEYMDFDYN